MNDRLAPHLPQRRPGLGPVADSTGPRPPPPGGHLHAVPLHDGSTRLRVSVLSTSPIARTGLRELLACFPDRVTLLDDTGFEGGGFEGGGFEGGGPPAGSPSRANVLVLDVAALHHPAHREAVETLMRQADAVVAVATGFSPDLPVYLRGTGVTVCVSPDISAPDLIATIEAAGTGAATATSASPADGRGPDALRFCRGTELGLALFSSREHQVVALIVDGRSNLEIAGSMYLSINSIKSYIRSAYRKMGVTTRPEAILWLLREGIGYTDLDVPAPRAAR